MIAATLHFPASDQTPTHVRCLLEVERESMLHEMAISLLNDLKDLPTKVTDPNLRVRKRQRKRANISLPSALV